MLHLCREYGISPSAWRRLPREDKIDMIADYDIRGQEAAKAARGRR